MQISTTRLAAAVVIAIASLILAVWVPARVVTTTSSRARSRYRVAAAIAAIGCTVAVIASPMVGPVQVPRAAPSAPTCSTTTPRVCVWPEDSAYLPLLTPVAERVADASDGVLTVPDEFMQEGLASSPEAGNTFTWLALDAGVWQASEGLADAVLNTTYMPANCWPVTDAGWDKRRNLSNQLRYWLTARGYEDGRPVAFHGTFDDTASAQAALKGDEASQKLWAAGIVQQIKDMPCVVPQPS
jgi:hypothetical protein